MSHLINTERAYLKLLIKRDYADILLMFEDNEAFQYIPHLENRTRDYYQRYLDDKLTITEEEKGYYWIARFKGNNDFIGCLNVTPISEKDPRIQIGWITRRQYWGQGLAKELAIGVFHYSSEKLKLREIYGFFDKEKLLNFSTRT